MRRLALLCALLSLAAVPASAQTSLWGVSQGNSKNVESTSAANAAVSVTLTPGAATRGVVYMIAARCSAGTSSVIFKDGGTQAWSTDAAFIGTTTKVLTFSPGWTGSVGNAVVITLATCGGGNTGVLSVQADIF